jgi:hypothetical protein
MCSLPGQICSGRASKLALQWTELSRPAVPQRPRLSLCKPSSPASRPYKACLFHLLPDILQNIEKVSELF